MSEAIAPASTVTPDAAKSQRRRLGRMASPISAVRVFRKVQTHPFGGKQGVSWAVVTPDNKIVKATTYDGDLGKDFNLGAHNTSPVPTAGTKDERKAFKGYSEVNDTAEFPAFVTPASNA